MPSDGHLDPTFFADPLFLAFISGAGGATLTLLAGAIGATIRSKRDNARWRSEQRLAVYGQFLASVDNFLGGAHRRDLDSLPLLAREQLSAIALVHLMGPDDVYQAAAALQSTTKASISELESEGSRLSDLEDARLAARARFIQLARKRANFTA